MDVPLRTVAGVFTSFAEVLGAAHDLEGIGIPSDSIGVIAGNDANRHDEYLKKARDASTVTSEAATTGAWIGGGLGIVATLVTFAIPGVGPILAGGAVLAGLGVGAAGVGMIAALFEMGIEHDEAPLYEESVRRGAVILFAHINDFQEDQVIGIMKAHRSRAIREQFDAFDPHPHPSNDTVRTTEPIEVPAFPAGGGAYVHSGNG